MVLSGPTLSAMPQSARLRYNLHYVEPSVLLLYAGCVLVLGSNRLGLSLGLEAVSRFNSIQCPVRRVVRLVLQKFPFQVLYLRSGHVMPFRQPCEWVEVSLPRGPHSVNAPMLVCPLSEEVPCYNKPINYSLHILALDP